MRTVQVADQAFTFKSHATLTGLTVGGCTACGAGNALETLASAAAGTTTTCQNCGVAVRLTWVYGSITEVPCDGTCMGATGPHCSCACGGRNHGRWYLPIEYVPILEQDKARKAQAARIHKHATAQAKKRQTLDDKIAALVDAVPALVWLTYLPNLEQHLGSRFLDDMRTALLGGKMSPRQIETAALAIGRDLDRADKAIAREKSDAERRKTATPAPLGRLVVKGVVTGTKLVPDPYSFTEKHTPKMRVEHADGWAVWITVPGSLTETKDGSWINGGLDLLKGCEIQFTATLEAGKTNPDPLFVFGKRPTKATVTRETDAFTAGRIQAEVDGAKWAITHAEIAAQDAKRAQAMADTHAEWLAASTA